MSADVMRLRDALAPRIAPVLLRNVTTQYPYHDAHVYTTAGERFDPMSAHPAFGNSFDWHSSVHSHWTALEVLRRCESRGAPFAGVAQLREAVERNLTPQNIAAEAQYLRSHHAYERPYGWAWTLRLASARPLQPMLALAEQIAAAAVRWLAALPSPIRTGAHANTAFSLGLMLDAARQLRFPELEASIAGFAARWYFPDRDYPAGWERGGYDFLSGGLSVADLVRRLMPRDQFTEWWRSFLPALDDGDAILAVAAVPDVRDGQIVHLHGLNLSRAGMLARVAGALGDSEARRLADRARTLYDAGLQQVDGADYLSTHWLPTFAWDAASSLDAL